jgi:Resolvase, N terminal domain
LSHRFVLARRCAGRLFAHESSATNVGTDKDSDKRQRGAIEAFAKRAGFEIVAEFYDAAVSGADHIDTRPGFAAMLERIEGNGVRTIIVERANRFARDLMVQEVGYAKLRERGIELIAADSPTSFLRAMPPLSCPRLRICTTTTRRPLRPTSGSTG